MTNFDSMSVQQDTEQRIAAPHRRWQAWRVALVALQAAVAVALVAKYVVSAGIVASIFGYAFQVDESESMIVAETLLMDRGTNIYDPPRTDIFISAPYTPLYYLLTWPGAHWGGALPSFKPGRALSLLAVAGIIVLLVLLVAHLSRQWRGKADWLAAGLSGAVFGSLGLVAFWGSAVKPDMTAVFFGLLCLYCGARWLAQEPNTSIAGLPPSTSAPVAARLVRLRLRQARAVPKKEEGVRARRIQQDKGLGVYSSDTPSFLGKGQGVRFSYFWLYAAAGAGALALLTKQTGVAGAAAFGFYLVLVRRDLWATLRFGLAYVVLSLVPMLLLNAVTGGGFWYHIVTVHQLPWDFEGYAHFGGEFVQTYALYVVLAVISIVVIVVSKKRSLDVLAALYVLMGLLASLSAGTYGGNHNHFLDPAVGLALAVGLLAARLRAWLESYQVVRVAYAALLTLVALQAGSIALFEGKSLAELRRAPGFGTSLQALATYDWMPRQYRDPRDLDPERRFDQIAAYMSNAAGPVYSDNVSLVLASGKPLTTTDPYTQTHAVHFARWDESRLVADMRARRYTVVALTDFPPADSPVFRDPKSNDLGEAGIFVTPDLARAVRSAYGTPRKDKLYVFERK